MYKFNSFRYYFLFIILITGAVYSQGVIKNSNTGNDFSKAVKDIYRTMQQHIYNPEILKSPEFKTLSKKVDSLGLSAANRKEFIDGFNNIWKNGPFSHVRLDEKRMSAVQLANYLDTMRINGKGAVLSWDNDIAVLTVYTMMGQNTIKEIDEAYNVICNRNPKSLIIDLRKNQGGAFAVRPLVGHLLSSNLETGTFISHAWWKENNEIPSKEYIQNLKPWQGWSIKSFWNDVETSGVQRIVFEPIEPIFAGKIYVLISNNTASAAELAADAIKSTGKAVLIGEKTAGQMLSQKMYDITQNFQLSLPIADYYSANSGRIEGNGIMPNITIDPNKAFEKAKEIILGNN